MAHASDLTTEEDIDRALEEAKLAPPRPSAIAAEYDRRLDVVVLKLDTGRRWVIPREQLQGLAEATELQIVQIEIFGGQDIAWPQLDVDHYLPHLLEGHYGSDRWMKSLDKYEAAA